MRPNKHKERSDWNPYKDPSRIVICISCGTPYSLGDKPEPSIKLCNKCEGKERGE